MSETPNPQSLSLYSNVLANTSDLPEWMQEDAADSSHNEALQKHVIPPRLVLRNPTSGEPLDQHDEGTPVIMPDNVAVGKFNKAENKLEIPLIVVPIFMYTEYTLRNPYKYREELGAVRERSFDHNSELAQKARNPQTREIVCPEKPDEKCRYMTELNFLFWVLGEGVPGMPLIHTFKSTEQNTGAQLSSMIMSRRGPMFGQQFFLQVSKRSNQHGKWYGFDPMQPTADVGTFVADPQMYNVFKEQNAMLKEALASNTLKPMDADEDYNPNKGADYHTGDDRTIDGEVVNEDRF